MYGPMLILLLSLKLPVIIIGGSINYASELDQFEKGVPAKL